MLVHWQHVAGLRQRNNSWPCLPPSLVLAPGRAVRGSESPGPRAVVRCVARHAPTPQTPNFGLLTNLLISVLHTVGTAVPVQARSDYTRPRPDPKTDQKKKRRKAKSPVSTTSMLRRLAGLTSGTTADAQTATPRIFGRRRAAEAKPPPRVGARGQGRRGGPAEAKGAPPTAADAKAGAAPPRREPGRAPPGSPPPRPRRRRSPTWRASSNASARPRTPPPRAGARRP